MWCLPEDLSKTDVWILLGCAEGVSEQNPLIYKAHLKHEMSTNGETGDHSFQACQISPMSSYQKENIFSQEINIYIMGLINSNEVSKHSVSKFPLTEMRLRSCSWLYFGFLDSTRRKRKTNINGEGGKEGGKLELLEY